MILNRRYFTASALASSLCSSRVSAQLVVNSGVKTGKFAFKAWNGPSINVYYVEPDTVKPDAPIIIVMHGASRNANVYRDNWIALSKLYGFAVYAPEFTKKHFPKSKAYNLGGLTSPKPRSFDAIEPLFDFLKDRRHTNQNTYYLFGHSAGAQFVHRFVFFRSKTRYKMAIAANAGWYTLTSKKQNWPYGLGKLKTRRYNMIKVLQKPLVILLGEKDNIPNDKNLRTTSAAMAQGSNRLARGIYFLKTAKAAAMASGVKLKWRFQIVPNVGHDNKGMAIAAASLIAKDVKEKNGK